MSERLLEYNETTKICLICGCHTEQAINIYEPRSGPNIIEIIQAKFKFQPVNDDKYLCFSCNNWLINWHSLQVLNTKEADSNHPSGKSRLNNCIPEESESYLDMHLNQIDNQLSKNQLFAAGQHDESIIRAHLYNKINNLRQNPITKHRKKFYFARRRATNTNFNKKKRNRTKTFSACVLCGHPIALRSPLVFQRSSPLYVTKCRNCRRILKWRTAYLKSIIEEENRKLRQIQAIEKSNQIQSLKFQSHINLVTPLNTNQINQTQQSVSLRTQRPLVDGKVVAMLRRLGTTLTREGSGVTATSPIIMSPAKKKPQKPTWKRNLFNSNDSDVDIILDFNVGISEVLPMVADVISRSKPPDVDSIETIILDDDEEDEINSITSDLHVTGSSNKNYSQFDLDEIYSKIPKCVSVSVIDLKDNTNTTTIS